MNQISVPYSAGGSQALGVASAEQRLLAALLREPSYIPQVRAQLSPDKFLLPQQRELYQAMLDCQQQGGGGQPFHPPRLCAERRSTE